MNIVTGTHRSRTLALASGIAGLLVLATTPPTNGAAACKATSLAGQSAFYVSNFYLWNASSSTQYLTCFMPHWNLQYAVPTAATTLDWTAGATGGTVTCTAQSGYYYGGNLVAQGSTLSMTLSASQSNIQVFPSLSRAGDADTVNLICRVPPGFKLGLIEQFDPDPPSGFGWVP